MTDRAYTDADLRTEAARQHKAATEDPDFTGIGEQMEGSKIPSRGDFQWDQLGDEDFDTAQRSIDDLLANAADTSEWAIALGAAGLKPAADIGVRLTTGGYPVAFQIAVDPELTDDARDELVTELQAAITATVSRVLGCTAVQPTDTA